MGEKNWILREYLSQKEAYWCGSALVLTSTLSACECVRCVCVIACMCVRVIACVCARLSLRTMHVHSQDAVCMSIHCNPACVYVDQNHMCHFCTKSMINATFLRSQWGESPCYWAVMCLFSPPVLSWGRCHASSLIDSQISMSLYDTPGSCGCDEHQHSHWFCRSTSIELRVQPSSQHMYLCAQLLHSEQRSYRKFYPQKSRILAGVGEGKSPLTSFCQ